MWHKIGYYFYNNTIFNNNRSLLLSVSTYRYKFWTFESILVAYYVTVYADSRTCYRDANAKMPVRIFNESFSENFHEI